MDASAPDHETAFATDGSEATAPHNIEAEQAVLGGILYENEVWHRVSDYLRPEHFYDPFHGRLYAKVSELIGAGAAADAVLIKNRMADDEGMKALGGPVYLIDLMREAPDSVSAPEYARLVYELAMRRELIAAAEEIMARARDTSEQGNAADLIEYGSGVLFGLSEGKTRSSGPVRASDASRRWLEMVEAARKSGRGLSGLSTGLRSLDAKLGGLAKSDLIIIAGRPSMGKSALAENIAFACARAGSPAAMFSLEMSDEQMAGRRLSSLSGIGSNRQREGKLSHIEMAELIEANQILQDLPLFIDHTGGLTVSQLRHRCLRLKRTEGLELVVVDYLQLMRAVGKFDGRVNAVSEITMRLKALAKELNVPVVALSQLSRAVEQRDDKKPQLSDLRESGSIEQDADVVLFCYREAYYLERAEPKGGTPEHMAWEDEMREKAHIGEVIIGKQRHGPIGSVRLHWDGVRTQFSDLEDRP